MNSRQRKVLVDTNVWLDYFLPWREHADAAQRFVQAALARDCTLLYAVHGLKDVFYLVADALKRRIREETGTLEEGQAIAANAVAWGCVECIRENAVAVGADESDAWLASNYRGLSSDLEDNLVLAAIQRAQVDLLVTSDFLLLKKATVEAHTPADVVALFEIE